MKRKILTSLILICLTLFCGAFAFPSVFADGLLIEDGYYPFESPYYLHADEYVTIVGEGNVYVVAPDNSVTKYQTDADKAIYSNGKLITLTDGDLLIDGSKKASSVIDFDVEGKRLAYVDNNAVYLSSDFTTTEIATVNQSGFSSVAVSGNGTYLKKDMGAYNDVYFCDNATLTVKSYLTHLKKFASLIFDVKLWGADTNVLYDINDNTKNIVSPYANAVSVYGGSVYYLADGCLYKDGKFLLGSGKDFYFPTSVDSNANGIYVTDENGVSRYSYSDGKYVKASDVTTAKASHVAVTSLPTAKVYYTLDTDVYLDDNVIYSVENDIIDIVADGTGNVYYSTNDNTYKNQDELYDLGGILAIAPSKKDLYIYDGNNVYKNGTETVVTEKDAISFDVDGNGNIYLLTSQNINCYSPDGTLIKTVPHNAKDPVDIDVSYESNNLGKLSVVDGAGHNVVFVDANVYVPSFSAKDTAADEELIRSVKFDTPVFKDLNKSEIIETLSASSIVLCSTYNLECDDFLSHVLFKNGNKLLNGYVKRDDLSEAILGDTPRYDSAVTIYDNVMLHTLPFGLQETDNQLVQVIANTDSELALLSKYSVFGEEWYKAEYDGKVGYVSATQIQLGAYVPSLRPDTNAKLVKVSAVYDKVNGKFVEDAIFLDVGTEVQVVGVFDSNTSYTQIKYYDSEAGGTRTCYVRTDALKYDYVTFEQQFALIAIILLSVSMIVVIIIFAKTRRKSA